MDAWHWRMVEQEKKKAEEKRYVLALSLRRLKKRIRKMEKMLGLLAAEVEATEMNVMSYPNPYSEGTEYKDGEAFDGKEDKESEVDEDDDEEEED